MRFAIFVPALLLNLSAAGRAHDAKDKAVKEELKALSGAWEGVTAVRDGKDLPKPPGGIKMILDDTRMLRFGDKVIVAGKITVDPAASPRTMDVMATEGEGKGASVKGIYELKGDMLKIAFADVGKERPADFNGKGATVYTYKRAKP
jgi:uncharacterized protein (TIGR03067 family)